MTNATDMQHDKKEMSDSAEKTESLRRCIVCKESFEKTALVRFVAAPDDTIVPDVDEKLPGKGVWVSCNRDALEMAVKKGLFSKALRKKVTADESLPDRVETLLKSKCADYIGLCRRAGLLVAGYEKVKAALKNGRVYVLFAASDGAPDACNKLKAMASGAQYVTVLSGDELGEALGRERCVHMAVGPGALAEKLLMATARLSRWRSAND